MYNEVSAVSGGGITSDKPVLLCFSHLRWNFVYQRPQHLMTRAARDFHVIYFEEPVFEDKCKPHLRSFSARLGIEIFTPVLPTGLSEDDIVAAQKLLLDSIGALKSASELVTWFYSPMPLAFAADLDVQLCIYDCMDELSNFHGAPAKLKEFEKEMFARADLVFTGGMSLYQAKRSLHAGVHAFPSSIDAPHFAKARADGVDPADQQAIARPRIGFFGVIDERMDVTLVKQLADRRPDWQFVLIGPVVKIDPGVLPQRDNIHWLGQKSYDELPRYLGGWNVGFMPFARNEATRYISPTKTPEFLAAGLPVVSTPIVDVVAAYGERDLVKIADSASAFEQRIAELLERPDPAWKARVDAHLATTSWDRTWQQMRLLMQMELSGSKLARSATPALAKSRVATEGELRAV